MKRAIMAAALAALLALPATSFAIPPDHPLAVPKVPEMTLIPTRVELELMRDRQLDREWIEVMHTMPQYRMPLFGDYEQELRWGTSPFGSPFPMIVLFRF